MRVGEAQRRGDERLGRANGRARQPAEMRVVERQHLVRHVDCGGGRAGLRSFDDEPAEIAIAREIIAFGAVVEHVRRLLAEQRDGAMVATDERAGAIGM